MVRSDMTTTLLANSILGIGDLAGFGQNSTNSDGAADSSSDGQSSPSSDHKAHQMASYVQGRGKRHANKMARQLGLSYTTKDGKVRNYHIYVHLSIDCLFMF